LEKNVNFEKKCNLPFSREGKTNINYIFALMLVEYGVPRGFKCKKNKIVGFRYKINDIDYVFAFDPNDVIQISFKGIKVLCEKNSIP
jgi:hypothetical protein